MPQNQNPPQSTVAQDRWTVRMPSFAAFANYPPVVKHGNRHHLMRGQNFIVEWIEAGAEGGPFEIESEFEMFVLLPDAGATLTGIGAVTLGATVAGRHTLCILPAGQFSVQMSAAGPCAVIASQRSDIDPESILNAETYRTPDPRIDPAGRPFRRRADKALSPIQIYNIDDVVAPADNPRLKMFQTETLSINWVEYTGERDRTALSPHTHTNFEQGSLAIAGNYLHHLRVEWGKNADLWREDEHVQAPSPSMMVVPVHMIHTTEGVGGGRHLLIDVFSPPRNDFIAKGWMLNAADYQSA